MATYIYSRPADRNDLAGLLRCVRSPSLNLLINTSKSLILAMKQELAHIRRKFGALRPHFRGVIGKAGHMSVRRYCAAALTGLTLLLSYAPSPVMAQGISVLKKGTNAVLDVPMNRAVVVEADVMVVGCPVFVARCSLCGVRVACCVFGVGVVVVAAVVVVVVAVVGEC